MISCSVSGPVLEEMTDHLTEPSQLSKERGSSSEGPERAGHPPCQVTQLVTDRAGFTLRTSGPDTLQRRRPGRFSPISNADASCCG